MLPWDFDRHLDSQYRKCKVCQWYLINDKMLQDHMELEHPMVAAELVKTKEQVTRDSAILDTSRQDHQVNTVNTVIDILGIQPSATCT